MIIEKEYTWEFTTQAAAAAFLDFCKLTGMTAVVAAGAPLKIHYCPPGPYVFSPASVFQFAFDKGYGLAHQHLPKPPTKIPPRFAGPERDHRDMTRPRK